MFAEKGWMILSKILTARLSSEIGLYDVEIFWSFSGLGTAITFEFFHIWDNTIRQRKVKEISQVIKCKRSEVF